MKKIIKYQMTDEGWLFVKYNREIPLFYPGIMAVALSFLNLYLRIEEYHEAFELIDKCQPHLNGKGMFYHLLVRWKDPNASVEIEVPENFLK